MIVALAVLAVLVLALLAERNQRDRTFAIHLQEVLASGAEERARHEARVDALLREVAAERADLLVRVQHPEVILPPRAAEGAVQPEPVVDEIDLVGAIRLSPEDADLAVAA